ncbi:MAG: hypothetical protein Q9162_007292 [Coniocarpon cinnabarinum]
MKFAVPALAASAALASAVPTVRSPLESRQAANVPALDDLIKAKGKVYFGTASDFYGTTAEASDAAYQKVLNNSGLFGQQTPANAMKFQPTEPNQGQFTFGPGDNFVKYAKANGQLIRCHNLIWQSQLPSYITSRQWTPADNATLTAIMKEHITNVVTHFSDACYAWDVVNEPLNGDGTYATASPFYNAIGAAYIPLAFQFASDAVKQTGKDIKLYVNEYGTENPGAKATALLNIVKDVKNRGIKIDGVGFESHFIVGQTPSRASQTSVKQQFAAAGVDVAVTELDVRFSSLPPTQAQLQQQATDYVNSVGSCLDVPRCVGVTVWDFDDKYSWIPSTFSGQGQADLFNSDLTVKPAVAAIAQLLQS